MRSDILLDADEALRASIDKSLRALVTPRDDWQHAHISDLYGCDYETWARRSSAEPPVEERDGQGALRMSIGNDYEDKIAAGILAHYGEKNARRGERIAWNPYTGAVRRGLLEAGHDIGVETRSAKGTRHVVLPCIGCKDCAPLENELIGHLDVTVAVDGGETVVEIKSTSRFAVKKAVEAVLALEHHYVDQAAGYGIAITAKAAGIFIADRDTCEVTGPLWIDLDAVRERIVARAKEVLERTNSEAFPPEPKPRYDWQPKYCSLGDACACKPPVVHRIVDGMKGT